VETIINKIFISPKSNYWSLGKNFPGDAPTHSLEKIQCDEGKGLVGDRFYGFKKDYRGQVTFISKELLDEMKSELEVEFPYETLRRNILISGINPLDLVGKRFQFGRAVFEGINDCAPCGFWNKIVKKGATDWLRNRQAGGLRAIVSQSGIISVGDALKVNHS